MKRTVSPTVKVIEVNDREILDFTSESTSELVIIPLSVAQKLADLLTNIDLDAVIIQLRNRLGDSDINTIEGYLQVLQEELDFHNTVNLLTTYEPNLEHEVKFPNISNNY